MTAEDLAKSGGTLPEHDMLSRLEGKTAEGLMTSTKA